MASSLLMAVRRCSSPGSVGQDGVDTGSLVALQHAGQPGNAPVNILALGTQLVLTFAELVALGQGNHLLDGFGCEDVFYHGLLGEEFSCPEGFLVAEPPRPGR
jgi:hypothetical protein